MKTSEISNDRSRLELDPLAPQWYAQTDKHKLLFIAINMPGYYSLPARILTLLPQRTKDIEQRFDSRYVEITNDQSFFSLLQLIVDYNPDIVAFSINIWNRNQCIEIAREIRKQLPHATLLGGGQEITRSAYDFFEIAPDFDYLIEGEGEIPLLQFLRQWQYPGTLKNPLEISGLRYKTGNEIAFTGQAEVVDSLDEIPSVILAGLVPSSKKYLLGVMIEGSRGCPFRCSFCFEGAQKEKVRTASIERLHDELEYMVNQGATYFHMMDAILCNSNPSRLKRLRDIFEKMRRRLPNTVISAELYADKITEDITPYLSTFSIIDLGLQTTNPATAKAIHRSFSAEKYKTGVDLLRKTGSTFNIYLICGLPYETLTSFLRGIRFIMDLYPTRIFINELCLLNGTELRHRAVELGYIFDQQPPYIVTETAWMPRFTLKTIQVLSKAVERRYNLTTRAIHTTAPWLPKHPRNGNGRLSIRLQKGCSVNCSGCRAPAISTNPDREEIAAILHNTADMDMDIYAGDHSCQSRDLLQAAGLLKLSATARNRLIAPLSSFSDPKTVELLVHRGFWHFTTFISLSEQNLSADAFDHLAVIDNFNHAFQLVGYASIRPYLEVVLLPGDALPAVYTKMIEKLARRKVTVVTVPVELAGAGPEWKEALLLSFSDAIEQRLWLKLPEQLAELAIAALAPDTTDEILALLSGFGLISDTTQQPPCFLS